MRKLLFLLFPVALWAQNPSPIQSTGTAPSGNCGSTNVRLLVPNGTIYTCQNGTWAPVSGGGGGGGTVTEVDTSAPISGGPITTTGTISCPTCVVGPASVTSGHIATFNGTTGKLIQDGGAVPTGTVTSVVIAGTSNQVNVAGTCTITTSGTCTVSLPAGVILGTDNSAAGTLQLANGSANAHTIWASGATTTNTIAGFTAVPTTGHVVTCTVVSTTCTLTDGGAPGTGTVTSAVIAGTANQITASGTCTITTTGTCTLSLPAAVILGTDNSTAGTLQLANSAANAHTIWSSGATTTNTIQGFATAPTTGHIVDCTVTSTTCLLHDSGVVTANVVNASSPGVGIAHFAGSTQTVTSSAVALGGADVSGVLTGAKGGNWVLLETHSASTSSEIDFTTCISSTYNEYKIVIENITYSTALTPSFQMSTNGGVSYDTTSGHYSWNYWALGTASGTQNVSSSDTGIALRNTTTTQAANTALNAEFILFNPNSSSLWKSMLGTSSVVGNGNTVCFCLMGGGHYTQTTAVNAFRLIPSTGTLNAGTIYCYGINKT